MAFSSASENPYQMTWKIESLRSRKRNESRRSTIFPKANPKARPFAFQMEFIQENDKEVNIKLYMVKGDGIEHCFDYRISYVNSLDFKQFVRGGRGRFREGHERLAQMQSNCVSISDLVEYEVFCAGNVRIHCDIHVPGWNIPKELPPPPKTYAIQSTASEPGKLCQDIHDLLKDGEMSDVTLVFGGKEFAAHKLILSARSSVLRTLLQDDIKSESVENTVEIPEIGGKELPDHKLILSAGSSVYKITLQHDFKENLEKKVDKYDIPDIDEEVGQELLAFLYTEKAPNLDRFAIELLVASHKYKLDSLKSACEQALSAKLAIDSVAKVLVLADAQEASQLKGKCIDFISDHSKQVMATEGWKDVASHLELVTLLLEQISLKK